MTEVVIERERPCYSCGAEADSCKSSQHCCSTCEGVGRKVGHTYTDLEIAVYRAITSERKKTVK